MGLGRWSVLGWIEFSVVVHLVLDWVWRVLGAYMGCGRAHEADTGYD